MKMQHPAFADVTIEVDKDKVDEAVEAGWLKPNTAAAKRVKADEDAE